jgi:hypothetical protein
MLDGASQLQGEKAEERGIQFQIWGQEAKAPAPREAVRSYGIVGKQAVPG